MDRHVKIYLVEYCEEQKGNNPKSLGKLPSSKCVVQVCSLVRKEKNTYLTAVLKNKFHMQNLYGFYKCRFRTAQGKSGKPGKRDFLGKKSGKT